MAFMLLNKSWQRAGESMKKIEDRSDGGMHIIANQAHIHMAPAEAYALWQWLSARKDAFQAHSNEKQLERHLSQEDLSHLDESLSTNKKVRTLKLTRSCVYYYRTV
jgi:hypothetical protein